MTKKKTLKDYYRQLRSNGDIKVNYKKFIELYRQFVRLVHQELQKGNRVTLGHFGDIFIMCRPVLKFRAVDFNRTKKLWLEDEEARENRVKVYHLNEETDFKFLKLNWTKSTCRSTLKEVYRVANSCAIKKIIKDEIKRGNFQIFEERGRWRNDNDNG